jgi:hypothetical protein
MKVGFVRGLQYYETVYTFNEMNEIIFEPHQNSLKKKSFNFEMRQNLSSPD